MLTASWALPINRTSSKSNEVSVGSVGHATDPDVAAVDEMLVMAPL